MFSRYTWWDFFIVGGVITVLYYAYVAVVYYREDIREWLSSKGSKTASSTDDQDSSATETDEEEPMLYSVHSYGSDPKQESQKEVVSSVPAPPTAAMATGPAPAPVTDLDLAGAVITEEDQANFDLPINGSVHRAAEERLDDVLEAAEGVNKDENGLAKPKDEQNQPATRIASMINYQASQAAFADIFSNR